MQVLGLKFSQLGWANRNMDCVENEQGPNKTHGTFSISSMTEHEPSSHLSSLLPAPSCMQPTRTATAKGSSRDPAPSYMQPTRSTTSKGSSRDLHPSSTWPASFSCFPSSKGSCDPTSQSNRQGIVQRISSTGRDETRQEQDKTKQDKNSSQ